MKIKQFLAIAVTMVLATAVQADNHGDLGLTKSNAGCSQLIEKDSDVVIDGDGDIVRLGGWNASNCEEAAPVVEKTPEPEPVVAEPEPEPVVVEPTPEPLPESFSITRFNFDNDDMETSDHTTSEELEAVINYLENTSKTYVTLTGHTDSVGPESYNQELSVRRANDVSDYLVSRGIDKSRIVILGRGEDEPVATNDTREGRALNRRVEVEVRN